jgi:hypothetical protein
MLGELVLVDIGKVLRSVAPWLLNIPKAERESGVRIVGICENGAGGFTVHTEASDPNSLENVRAACQNQVTRLVKVVPDPYWRSDVLTERSIL